MRHKDVTDVVLHLFLFTLDRHIADRFRSRGCPRCGGPLYPAPYPRHPRGQPAMLDPLYQQRFSFLCGRPHCRKRLTPPSVRFLGRRWYVAVAVLIASALRHGETRLRRRRLRTLLQIKISRRTLQRWWSWWRSTFRTSHFWRQARALFVPPVDEARLPMSIVEAFGGRVRERVAAALTLLKPITTSSAPGCHAP